MFFDVRMKGEKMDEKVDQKVIFVILYIGNKCSDDRSMKVKLPALLGNYDRPTN